LSQTKATVTLRLMARLLRWLGVGAFVAIPVVLSIGRPRAEFDAPAQLPGWVVPSLVGLAVAGFALLIAAALVALDSDSA